jgi:hypothetical protein
MNTQNKDKRAYTVPLIERILLDNEISLILESDPPFGPDESISYTPEYFNNDPFKSNVG